MERIKFSISFSFVLVFVCAILLKKGELFVMYTVAMLLHESSHYIVAKKQFFQCTKMQLSAFGAVLYGEFSDAQGSAQTKIALAGPAANIVAGGVFVALWWIVPESFLYTLAFVEANLSMALVNLIPCYPLDGGKVLLGIIEHKYDVKKSLKIVKGITVVLSLLLFLVFCISLFTETKLFSLGLFSIFLLSGYIIDNDGRNYRRISFTGNYTKRLKVGLENKTLVFSKDVTFDKVICRMQGSMLFSLDVVDDQLNIVAKYNYKQLDKLLKVCPQTTKLSEISKYLDY